MHLAYRFALDPNDRQRSALASHCGAARFAFNWGLGLVRERLGARAAGQEVHVPWTLPELRREWNRAKPEVAPWWGENSKEAYSSGLDGLVRALNNFSESRRGRRRGRRVGFPRFRKRGRRDSCRFTTGAIRVDDERHLVLPRLGRLRTLEATGKLLADLEAGGRILSATISREADRWFCSFTVEVERESEPNSHRDVLGVDLGLNRFATYSDGESAESPRPLRKQLRKLRRLSRAHSRKRKGSQNRRRSAQKLARCHAKIANRRRDFVHKLTSQLAKSHGVLVVEDLNVSGMLGNRHLSRAIADSGWAEFVRQLSYKCGWYGSWLVVAPRFLASSKTCSGCGVRKQSLELSERIFRCEDCGLELDRDLNAARNLEQWARMNSMVAGSAPETLNACGGERKTAGSAAAADEAGTEQPQRAASDSEPTDTIGGPLR
ncbi:MAG: IS607 family element transposase accessory protein TnpB [Candidatus Dormibacteraeota bacterium]|nr:IS607 family element transposase accessory protein TnpB [Candidatus Dormibacteraeota bacterium]